MSNIPSMTGQELYSAYGGQRVFVYFNLHTKKWSVRLKSTGRVVAHCTHLSLSHASPVVSEAGRQRVIREKRKNVHAGIVGVVSSANDVVTVPIFRRISYNPYMAGNFVWKESDDKFDGADYALFNENGVCAGDVDGLPVELMRVNI